MTLVKFNPINELLDSENQFFKIANYLAGFVGNKYTDSEIEKSDWFPTADIYEDKDNFKLKLDLPGVEKDDVKITFANNQISVSGERKQLTETENHKYHLIERSYGRFYRSFDLPKEIEQDNISAEFKNGQLTINVPKSEKIKPKQIEVKIK